MPVVKIKTIESKVGWTNPENADMVSNDLVVDVNGRKAEVRTFSKAIAEVGFEGEVETYEKKDHTYLRQVKTDQYMSHSNSGSTSKPAYKDNSDGMRQGMCINNAANYVAHNHTDADRAMLNSDEWAKLVWNYANDLYLLGDLGNVQEGDVVNNDVTEEAIDLSDIKDIFGN